MNVLKKKAQQLTFSGAPALVVTFALIILIAAAMAVGVNSFRDTSSNTVTLSSTDTNNTFTALNATAVTFSTDHSDALTCSEVTIYNVTGTNTTSLFTISSCSATLKEVNQNNTLHTAAYTYTFTGYLTAYNISSQGLTGLDNFSDQMPTVGTMLGVGLIIVVIISAFGFMLMRNSL